MSTHTFDRLTKSELLARGWTEGLIARALGKPDELRKNPHYKSGPPMRLYDRARVEPVEKTPEFAARVAAKAARKPAAQKAVATKKQKILDWVNALEIKIPRMPLDKLFWKSINHYNDYHTYVRGDLGKHASLKDSREFLVRLARNYLRHERTSYETALDSMFGKVGTGEGYARLRERIEEAIEKEYPTL